MLSQDTKHLIQRPCYQRGSPCQDQAGNRTTLRPDHFKETETAVACSCLPFIRSGQNHQQIRTKTKNNNNNNNKTHAGTIFSPWSSASRSALPFFPASLRRLHKDTPSNGARHTRSATQYWHSRTVGIGAQRIFVANIIRDKEMTFITHMRTDYFGQMSHLITEQFIELFSLAVLFPQELC